MPNKFTREITILGERVDYTLEYKNIKNVNIHCTPAKGLYISAPYYADLEKIDSYLQDNGARILEAVHRAKAPMKAPPKIRTERREITISGRNIVYELNYKNVKRLTLSIGEKGVRISAPTFAKLADIEDFMLKNSDFIIKSIDKHEKLEKDKPKLKTFSSGESFYFLGERKTIRVEEASKNYAEINGGELCIYTKEPENTALKSVIIDSFLKLQSEMRIPLMCRALYPRFKAKGIKYPKEFRFRKMISCWGNCRPERSIVTFSTYLIQLPEKCVEQVICHEFTHFLHADHSKAFYAQLAEFMPDYKECEKIIKQMQREIMPR